MSRAPAPGAAAEIVRDARPEQLRALLDFVAAACARAGLDAAAAGDVRLAAEEACTNVIEHGYAGRRPGPIAVRFARDADRAVVVIEDEAPPFDPAAAPAPALDAGWAERPLGGLGWHLVRQVMDEVRHEPRPGPRGGNRVTLVRRLAR